MSTPTVPFWQQLEQKIHQLYDLSFHAPSQEKVKELERELDEMLTTRYGTKGRMRAAQPGVLALFIHIFPSVRASHTAKGDAANLLPSWSPLQYASYVEEIHYTGEVYVVKHRHDMRRTPYLITESRENRSDLYPWKPYTP